MKIAVEHEGIDYTVDLSWDSAIDTGATWWLRDISPDPGELERDIFELAVKLANGGGAAWEGEYR